MNKKQYITWKRYSESSEYPDDGNCHIEWKKLFDADGMEVNVKSVSKWLDTIYGGPWSFERLLPTEEKKDEFNCFWRAKRTTHDEIAEEFVRLYKKQSLVDKIVRQALRS